MSATMFELADMRDALEAIIAEREGDLTPDLEAEWDAIHDKFETKVENTALLIRERLSLAEIRKAEAKRLSDSAKALENDAERLKALLLDRMQHFGKEKVKGTLVDVAIQANNPSVVTVVPFDEADLRNWYMFAPELITHTPESYALNKRAVLDAGKNAGVPREIGERIRIERTKSVRIR